MQWAVKASKTAGRWPRRLGNKGFSLVELVAAVAVLGLLVGVAMPNFLTMMRRSQVDAASRHILSDVNRARSLAIMTGWEYRVFGFNSDAPSPFANQYRLMARSTAAFGWPADTAAPSAPPLTPNQIAGPWVNMNNEYPGALINPGDPTPRFWVSFNARGVRIEDDSFDPLNVSSDSVGAVTNSLNVSLPGIVTIQ